MSSIDITMKSINCANKFYYDSVNPPSFGYIISARFIVALENVQDKPHGICTYIHTTIGRYFSTVKATEIIDKLQLNTSKVKIFNEEDE